MRSHLQQNSKHAMLVPDYKHQDEIFASAFSLLQEAIVSRTFPGASIAVTAAGKLIALKAFGRFVYEDELADGALGHARNPDVYISTLFDIASVTKVVATTTIAATLYERGLLELEAPIGTIVPEFLTDSARDSRRSEVTFRMILAHSSGLPAYEKLFLRARTRKELLQAAFTTPLAAAPGSRAEYSDIGFMILAVALERIAEESLDSICQREIFGPLAMANTTFHPPAELRLRIPPTANDQTFRHRIIQGEVQDENASLLGGVAGHAGLFSTAEDIARFAQAMICAGDSILRPATVELFTRRQAEPSGTSRALGWDTPSTPSQSGKHFGSRSFGHLGYTGTSLWIDPERQLSITLLTNRTWPDCANQSIKQFRPNFHDALMEALRT